MGKEEGVEGGGIGKEVALQRVSVSCRQKVCLMSLEFGEITSLREYVCVCMVWRASRKACLESPQVVR